MADHWRIPTQVNAVKVTEMISDLNEFRQLKNSPRDDVVDLRFDYDAFIRTKTKAVAWFVSNCVTTSGRENYVHKLGQFIDVDIYGKCGNLSCVGRTSCSEMAGKDSKFYLAFENSVCVNYVTEKFFNMLNYVEPIVFGLEARRQIAPPKSFIDADSLESPEALANYLHVLINNDALNKEYLQYFTPAAYANL